MDKKTFNGIASFYLQRFGVFEKMIATLPHPDTQTIVTIPCFNEPGLVATLQSLFNCEPTQFPVEILVMVNSSEYEGQTILSQNQKTIEDAENWISSHQKEKLNFHILHIPNLPKKHAGVGMARKAVMDEALRRFTYIGRNGAIICLDADCTVASNYLRAIEKNFSLNTKAGLAGIYYEHSYQTLKDREAKEGIVHYELFLRYYIQALAYADYPLAFHTVGSSMAVKTKAYAKHGGMNRRKAGEDFYFLHKIAPHETHINITDTTVFPSARQSDRVPFGTGKAQKDWAEGQSKIFHSYNPIIFDELKTLMGAYPNFYRDEPKDLPQSVLSFLTAQKFEEQLAKMRKNTTSQANFNKQLMAWLDGFKVMKFVHHARDHFHPDIPLNEAASTLLQKIGIKNESASVVKTLLVFRELDKG